MIKIKNFKKRLAIGAVSLLLLSPIALSNMKATHASTNTGQQLNDYVMMNVPPKQQQNHNLVHFWDENDPSYSRTQLKYVYGSTYNQTHNGTKSSSTIADKTNKLTNRQLISKLINIENHIEKELDQLEQEPDSKSNTSTTLVSKYKINNIKPAKHTSFSQFVADRNAYYSPVVEKNFRDLGGYQTKNGQHVKTGKILRSNDFHHLTRPGGNRMHQLHVHEVIDLRNHRQANMAPDKTFLHAKLNPVFTANSVTRANKYAKNHQLNSFQENQYNYNHLLTNSNLAKKSYRNTFHALLNNHHGSIVYHCIAGRDRTGITSILILNALGVPKKTAIRDYLLSDVYEGGMPLNKQYQLVQSFYNAADTKYGSVHKYIVHGVGISNNQIHQLQKMYLTK